VLAGPMGRKAGCKKSAPLHPTFSASGEEWHGREPGGRRAGQIRPAMAYHATLLLSVTNDRVAKKSKRVNSKVRVDTLRIWSYKVVHMPSKVFCLREP